MMRNGYGCVIAEGRIRVGKPFRGDPGFYWQDSKDHRAKQHGPYDTFGKAEEAARTSLNLTHDE